MMWCTEKGIDCHYCDILVNPQTEIERHKTVFKEGYEKGLDDGIKLNKAFHDEKCAEFDKLCYEYNKLLYIIRCNMTSITRYVHNENEMHNIKYKELAEKAVENILEAVNHKENEK